jgi:hypothetical protein
MGRAYGECTAAVMAELHGVHGNTCFVIGAVGVQILLVGTRHHPERGGNRGRLCVCRWLDRCTRIDRLCGRAALNRSPNRDRTNS